MKIDRQKVGSVGVVAPHGSVTQAEVEEFVSAVEMTRQSAAGRIVLDLSGVPYADSVALEALLDFADRQRSAGQSAKVAGLTDTLREILDVTDLFGEFEPFDSVETAVRSFL